jgi:hypothetical protein
MKEINNFLLKSEEKLNKNSQDNSFNIYTESDGRFVA